MNQEGLMERNRLSLTLFGSIQIEVNGRPVDGLASKKVRALLAYLAVEADRPHTTGTGWRRCFGPTNRKESPGGV